MIGKATHLKDPWEYAAEETAYEQTEQTALFKWVAIVKDKIPQLKWLFAVPNGGLRNRREAGSLKAAGVKGGISDMVWPMLGNNCVGLFIELKRKKIGVVSAQQTEFGKFVTTQRYSFKLCFGWLEARKVLIEHFYGEQNIKQVNDALEYLDAYVKTEYERVNYNSFMKKGR